MSRKKKVKVLLVDRKIIFTHLVYEYRCLVRAQFAFDNALKLNSTAVEIGTVARNAVLSKLRCILEFYVKDASHCTDFRAKDHYGFDLHAINQNLHNDLLDIAASMEVHDLHLTLWRDEVYRAAQPSTLARQRIDWDEKQLDIVTQIVELLTLTSNTLKDWRVPFRFLYETCHQALKANIDWPEEFSEPNKIIRYLQSLGL